jgi:hypothetical protein
VTIDLNVIRDGAVKEVKFSNEWGWCERGVRSGPRDSG